jgi:hypothetical protein
LPSPPSYSVGRPPLFLLLVIAFAINNWDRNILAGAIPRPGSNNRKTNDI